MQAICSKGRAVNPETLAALAETHHISDSVLSRWRTSGVDVTDSREVVRKIWKARTKPPGWKSLFDELTRSTDDDSKEALQRRKLLAEAERIELANSVAKGEYFPREDVDAANWSFGTAVKMKLAELEATLPPQLAGLDEVGVAKVLHESYFRMLSELSDLDSALWVEVMAKCAKLVAAGEELPRVGAKRA